MAKQLISIIHYCNCLKMRCAFKHCACLNDCSTGIPKANRLKCLQ